MKRFAIHVHVFYSELWSEIANCLKNFPPAECDIFITAPAKNEVLCQQIINSLPNASYEITENRGYDVGPFVETINHIELSQYEYIVKLHTKRNWRGWFNSTFVRGSIWRDLLIEFCATKDNLNRCLSIFSADPNVGVVASPDVIVKHGDYLEAEIVKQKAEMLIHKCGLIPRDRTFVGGTMFICRAKLLRPIQGLHSISDFDIIHKHELGTLAHVYERLLGYIISAQGYHIAPFRHSMLILPRLWFIIVPAYKVLSFIRNQMPDRRRKRSKCQQ